MHVILPASTVFLHSDYQATGREEKNVSKRGEQGQGTADVGLKVSWFWVWTSVWLMLLAFTLTAVRARTHAHTQFSHQRVHEYIWTEGGLHKMMPEAW